MDEHYTNQWENGTSIEWKGLSVRRRRTIWSQTSTQWKNPCQWKTMKRRMVNGDVKVKLFICLRSWCRLCTSDLMRDDGHWMIIWSYCKHWLFVCLCNHPPVRFVLLLCVCFAKNLCSFSVPNASVIRLTIECLLFDLALHFRDKDFHGSVFYCYYGILLHRLKCQHRAISFRNTTIRMPVIIVYPNNVKI